MLMFFFITGVLPPSPSNITLSSSRIPSDDMCKLISSCDIKVPSSVPGNVNGRVCTDFILNGYQLNFSSKTLSSVVTSSDDTDILPDELYQPSLYCLATLYGQFNRNNRPVEQGTSSLDKTVTCKDGPFTVDYFSCKSFVNLRDKLLKEKKTLIY